MVLFVRSRHGELTKSVFLVILLLWPHNKLQKRVWWHTKMFKSKQQSKRNKSTSVGGCCRGQNILFFLFAQSRAVLQQQFKPVLFGVWGGLKVDSVSDGFCCCWIYPQDKPSTYCCAVKSDKKRSTGAKTSSFGARSQTFRRRHCWVLHRVAVLQTVTCKMSGNDIIPHILTDWAAFYKGAAGISAHSISLLLINSLNDVIKPIWRPVKHPAQTGCIPSGVIQAQSERTYTLPSIITRAITTK